RRRRCAACSTGCGCARSSADDGSAAVLAGRLLLVGGVLLLRLLDLLLELLAARELRRELLLERGVLVADLLQRVGPLLLLVGKRLLRGDQLADARLEQARVLDLLAVLLAQPRHLLARVRGADHVEDVGLDVGFRRWRALRRRRRAGGGGEPGRRDE